MALGDIFKSVEESLAKQVEAASRESAEALHRAWASAQEERRGDFEREVRDALAAQWENALQTLSATHEERCRALKAQIGEQQKALDAIHEERCWALEARYADVEAKHKEAIDACDELRSLRQAVLTKAETPRERAKRGVVAQEGGAASSPDASQVPNASAASAAPSAQKKSPVALTAPKSVQPAAAAAASALLPPKEAKSSASPLQLPVDLRRTSSVENPEAPQDPGQSGSASTWAEELAAKPKAALASDKLAEPSWSNVSGANVGANENPCLIETPEEEETAVALSEAGASSLTMPGGLDEGVCEPFPGAEHVSMDAYLGSLSPKPRRRLRSVCRCNKTSVISLSVLCFMLLLFIVMFCSFPCMTMAVVLAVFMHITYLAGEDSWIRLAMQWSVRDGSTCRKTWVIVASLLRTMKACRATQEKEHQVETFLYATSMLVLLFNPDIAIIRLLFNSFEAPVAVAVLLAAFSMTYLLVYQIVRLMHAKRLREGVRCDDAGTPRSSEEVQEAMRKIRAAMQATKGHERRRSESHIHGIFANSDKVVLNELLHQLSQSNPTLIDILVYCRDTSEHTARTKFIELLCIHRSKELSVRSKSLVLHSLMVAKLSSCEAAESAAADLLLSVEGDDLSELKSMQDGLGDVHSMHKLVFQDFAEQIIRNRVLQHFLSEGLSQVAHRELMACGQFQTMLKQGARWQCVPEHLRFVLREGDEGRSPGGSRHAPSYDGRCGHSWLKIITDMDDTLECSGAWWPAGIDGRYSRHTPYPGVTSFYLELQGGGAASEDLRSGTFGNIVALSARPHVTGDVVERGVFKRFRKLIEGHGLHAMPTLLAGSIDAGGRFFFSEGDSDGLQALAEKKYESFVQFIQLYPEFRFVFIGDNGQADYKVGRAICEKFPHNVEQVFIHAVQPEGETWGYDPESGKTPIAFFENYVMAAVSAATRPRPLVSAEGLLRIAVATVQDFEKITSWPTEGHREAEAQRLNASVVHAQGVLQSLGVAASVRLIDADAVPTGAAVGAAVGWPSSDATAAGGSGTPPSAPAAEAGRSSFFGLGLMRPTAAAAAEPQPTSAESAVPTAEPSLPTPTLAPATDPAADAPPKAEATGVSLLSRLSAFGSTSAKPQAAPPPPVPPEDEADAAGGASERGPLLVLHSAASLQPLASEGPEVPELTLVDESLHHGSLLPPTADKDSAPAAPSTSAIEASPPPCRSSFKFSIFGPSKVPVLQASGAVADDIVPLASDHLASDATRLTVEQRAEIAETKVAQRQDEMASCLARLALLENAITEKDAVIMKLQKSGAGDTSKDDDQPPVRTSSECPSGFPGDSMVEPSRGDTDGSSRAISLLGRLTGRATTTTTTPLKAEAPAKEPEALADAATELQDATAKAKEQRSPKTLETIDRATSADASIADDVVAVARPVAEAVARIEGDRTSVRRSSLFNIACGFTGRAAAPPAEELGAATGNASAADEEPICFTVVEEGLDAQEPDVPHEASSEEHTATSAALATPQPEAPSRGRSLFAGLRNFSRTGSPPAAAQSDPQVDSGSECGGVPDASFSFDGPAPSAVLPPSSVEELLKHEEEAQGKSEQRMKPAISSSPECSVSTASAGGAHFEADA